MTNRFMDGYDGPWGPTGRYGGKLANWMVQSRQTVKAARLAMMYGFGPPDKFNNEGEKQMEKKIDWHKPLRSLKPGWGENPKVYTYKSGRQRVVWIDDRVYPVDEQGRTVAEVDYGVLPGGTGRAGAVKGTKIVENAPEEKFFLGLYRHAGTSNYFLEDDGMLKTRAGVHLIEREDQWIVDTRKPAEPPKEIVHDPKDWVAVYFNDDNETDIAVSKLMTETEASRRSFHKAIVRVRTTPPPADTARYIQLYRMKGSNGAWKINGWFDRQEMTADEAFRDKGQYMNRQNEYCNVKVRD